MQLNEVVEERREQADAIEPRVQWGGSLWRSERSRSVIIILLVVLFANSTYLFHVFNANPINQLSGLDTTVQPGLLQGENNIDPDIGFTSQALGHRAAVDWLHGQIPWWNPYEGVGAPLAGEMQSAALFPLNAFNLLPDGQLYFRIVLELAAGIGTYLLVRRFTRSNAPAVVGGIAFALNGTFSWLFHAPGNPVALLPFLLLGLEWAREGALSQRRKGWALVGAAIALSIYAGFPETALLDGLLAALWLVVRAFGLTRRDLITYIQSISLGVFSGILLAAPILVAFLDYIPNANLGLHNAGLATTSLSANTALPSQVLPYVFGPIKGLTTPSAPLDAFWTFIGGYLGISLCLLALIGLVDRRYRALRIALAIWIIVGLARLVGMSWAVHVVNAIPGVKWTIFIRYASPSWELALVVLAALGLDDLIRRSTARLAVVGSGAVMLVIILLCWHAAQPVFHALAGVPHNRAWAVASLTWSLAMVIGIVALGLLPDVGISNLNVARFRRGALASFVVLDVTAMFMVPQFSAARQAVFDAKPVNFLQQHLGEHRFYTLGPLVPNYGSYFGLSSVGLQDNPSPKAYANFIHDHLDTNAMPDAFSGTIMANPEGPTPAQELADHLSSYEAVGVKYVLLPAGLGLPSGSGPALRQVFSDTTTRILELPHPAGLFGAVGGRCSVHGLSETAVEVNCKEPSTIVYREMRMPGWHAQVNGDPVAVHADGQIFQSVRVPAGRSTVEFSFTPPRETVAFMAFGLGIALLVMAWASSRGLGISLRGRHRIRSKLKHPSAKPASRP
jgi:hypothetical protein